MLIWSSGKNCVLNKNKAVSDFFTDFFSSGDGNQ